MPKVSVIIPCYNYQNFIETAILSVICQRLDHDIEVIISDDCSSDNSFNIINRMANYFQSDRIKFKVSRNEVNLGEINNTKKLFELCEGDYIAYLDADDYWINPYKLQEQIQFMDENSDYSMCITGYFALEGDSFIPDPAFSNWFCPRDIEGLTAENLVNTNIVGSSSSRFFRNYKITEQIFKDYFYKFPYSDWSLNFEYSVLGKIKYLDFPSYVYRCHGNSLSSTDYKKMDYIELKRLRSEILNNELVNRKLTTL
jgi:glycosyltransferase involved in cell wall biosynthesis